MKLFRFEGKKLIRSAGFKYLCAALLILDFLFCLFGNLYSPENDEYITNYEDNIGYVIRVAERNLLEYEAMSEGEHYMTHYQRDVIERYSDLLESGVLPVKAQGWNEFFDNKADDLLPTIAAILAGALLCMAEFDNGTEKVLHMTARGRRSIWSKVSVLGLFSIAINILMTLASLAGIVLRFGLSSPTLPLCSVELFSYCPYGITIIEYLAISLFIKTLNLFCLSLFAALCAVLTKSYLASITLSFASVGAAYLISASTERETFCLLNPYTLALTDPLFERYRSLNIFNESIPLAAVSLILPTVICIFLAFLFSRLFFESYSTSRIAGIEKTLICALDVAKEALSSKLPRLKSRRRSLLASEAKKSFFKSHLLILCAVMICLKLFFCCANEVNADHAEELYRDKCYELRGELTDEVRALILEKLDECREVLAKFESMRSAVVSGMITNDEYMAYLDEHSLATAEQYVYMKLSLQCARIDAAAERGISAKIIYDTGWIAFFDGGADTVLFLLLLLFFCGIYENEYKTGFYSIASVSASGMKALHKAKLMLAVIVSVCAFAIFAGIDMIFLLRSFPLTDASFPLASARETALSMPIWCAVLAKYAVGIAVSILFSTAVCLLSRFLKKTYLVKRDVLNGENESRIG